MTVELVILLSFVAMILGGIFTGDNGLYGSFSESAPKLGARLEKQIETGAGFNDNTPTITWEKPR